MAIDLSKLSSEELFELARKRQLQEQEAAAQRALTVERVTELKKMRARLIGKHTEALAAADKALAELQQKRKLLLDEHEAALGAIDRELRELADAEATVPEKGVPAAPAQTPATPAQAPAPAPAATHKPVAAESPPATSAPHETINTSDELFDHVRELMLGRTYISESLLKEQLRSRNVTVNNLHKLLEQLVKDGRLSSKGGGNYALGRKA